MRLAKRGSARCLKLLGSWLAHHEIIIDLGLSVQTSLPVSELTLVLQLATEEAVLSDSEIAITNIL